MLQKISFTLAFYTVLAISVITLFFHVLILFEVIPFDVVWGGKLSNKQEMIRFESIALLMNILIIVVMFMIYRVPKNKYLSIIMYVFAGVFALNTVGNLFAITILEKLIDTPITFMMSILFIRLGKGK